MMNLRNLLTVDLEDWFTIEILANRYKFEDWPSLQSAVTKNSRRLLDLFRRRKARATWFVLGWCAEKYPGLIREIVDEGHEVGCHGYRHQRVDKLDRESFRKDTLRATEAISNAAGVRPRGYRAPSWSINSSDAWAFEVLTELGYEYDSSIFPIKHDFYGMPEGPRTKAKMSFGNGKSLYEIPCSTLRILGHNIPVSGGGYLRHSPYWYSRMMINALNKRRQPVVIYVHPWEIDPDLPSIRNLSVLQRLRMYGSTKLFYHKLDRLLSDFEFIGMAEYLGLKAKRRVGFERT
jgi:polysaccharide deacetylase family protein (PEP-CTERM system associated)